MKHSWILIPAFVLCCPVQAGNQDKKTEEVKPPWELYDVDEDGYITFKEATGQKMPKQTFEGLDIDRDGRLNEEEFTKMPPIPLD